MRTLAPRTGTLPRLGLALTLMLVLAVPGCAESRADAEPRWHGARLERVVAGLDRPVFLTAPPGDTARLFVVEQGGTIRILRDGRLEPRPFLDLRDRVRSGGERGLLSVAFHPRYAENGWLYVDYTDRVGDTRIERYHVSDDPDRADPASNLLLLHIAQPYSNHNGGLVAFGPDSMLYVGMGDGGSAGDPEDRAEDPEQLLGKLLRLDVDRGEPYRIPADNPFADGGGRPEIWAIGLRNPWRFAFDPPTRSLWIGDVGQDAWEEIDRAGDRAAGLDYGWRRFEGSHPFKPKEGGRPAVMPLLEYAHDDGCSVIGGVVYRGHALPALEGRYVYADYCSGWIRDVGVEDGHVSGIRRWDVPRPGAITSFGVDTRGELYVLTMEGAVWRVVAREPEGR